MQSKERTRILLLLSGGRDSFLSACKLIESGYHVVMVTFDNGCILQSGRAEEVAERIISIYGEDKASFIGIINIVGYIKEFYSKYYNMKPSEISKTYGEINTSQLNCLVCRTSMYICSVNICNKLHINKMAEGGRRVQGFVIELEEMIHRYREMLKRYNIGLELPVYELESDEERKNQLLRRGFLPKTCEAQCVIGVSLGESVDSEVIEGVLKYYDTEIEPRIEKLIEEDKLITFTPSNEINKKCYTITKESE